MSQVPVHSGLSTSLAPLGRTPRRTSSSSPFTSRPPSHEAVRWREARWWQDVDVWVLWVWILSLQLTWKWKTPCFWYCCAHTGAHTGVYVHGIFAPLGTNTWKWKPFVCRGFHGLPKRPCHPRNHVSSRECKYG